MLNFALGAFTVGIVAWWLARRAAERHAGILRDIYLGYAAPDETGRVGFYRDNRHGSPFTHPDSPWREPGGSESKET